MGCSLLLKSGTFWLEYLNIDVRIRQVGVFQVLEVFLSNVGKTGTFSGLYCFQKTTRVHQPTYLQSRKESGGQKTRGTTEDTKSKMHLFLPKYPKGRGQAFTWEVDTLEHVQ